MSFLCLCVSAGGVWAAGGGGVALGVSGQLRHPVTLLPLDLRRQPHHHTWHRHHGDRFPGLPWGHQGEQVSASECE